MTTRSNRRVFFMQALAAGSATAVALQARAADPAVQESDSQAAALGYKADTSTVDAKKYPKHAATQSCANCALYKGKAGDALGGCPLFAGKQVAAKGWCSAWSKKA